MQHSFENKINLFQQNMVGCTFYSNPDVHRTLILLDFKTSESNQMSWELVQISNVKKRMFAQQKSTLIIWFSNLSLSLFR